MRHHHWLAVALTFAVAGCGSSDKGNSTGTGEESAAMETAAKPDPCRLVTVDEVEAIIGEKIVSTQPSAESCTYRTADAQASSVTLELNQADAKGQMDTARRSAQFLKGMGGAVADKGGAGADVNQVLSESGDTPKVGDEAVFGPNQQLSVRKGDSYIAISPPIMRSRGAGGNPLLSADRKKTMAVEIAEKAVARLP